MKRALIRKRAKPVGLSDIYTYVPASWPYYDDILKTGQWIRAEVRWYDLEVTQGVYTWTAYDDIINRASAAGLNVLFLLNQPPAWAQTASFNTYVTNIATQLRTRYGSSIGAVEVFNEPNTPGFGWPFNDGGGAAQATRYAAAVSAFAAGWRPATGKIVMGALSLSNDPGGFSSGVFAAVPLADFDAFSIHPYGYSLGPPNMSTLCSNTKALMTAQYGATRPVWVTEMGTDVDANRLTVLSECFADVPNLDAFFWFSMRDLASSGSDYGVLEFDYTKKTAQYNALKAYLAAA